MSRSSRAWSRAGVVSLCCLLAGSGSAQEPSVVQPTPTFPRGVELVTVDVVVSDKAGNPVPGLTREDFTVLDEGQARPIETFDSIRLTAAPASEAPAGPPPPRPHLATNLPAGPSNGRSYVIVFDNLHLTPLNAQRAKNAIAAFLDKGVSQGDRITLIATGGGPWWSTTMPAGRADLIDLLKGLEGRRFPDNALERLTDYEAMRITVNHDTALAQRVQQRWETFGVKSRQESQQAQLQREQEGRTVLGVIDPYLENRASEAYLKAQSRVKVTFGVLERALKPLESSSDRKALLLVSEGFVFDPADSQLKAVTEAARRANAGVYFLDTRGLETTGFYSAQFGDRIDERDLITAIADTTQDGEGATVLAQDTGGFSVRNANDLTPGLLRIGRESRTYYLLGFDPPADGPRDGRFRKITVKVRGKGLTVRARKGYYAPNDLPATRAKEPEKGDVQFQEALDSPYLASDIPLRATAYVVGETTATKARTLVAVDADVSKLAFDEKEGHPTASFDLLIVVGNRLTGEVQRYDQKVELERKPTAAGASTWYSIVRDFDLASGGYQAKVVVRDVKTRKLGTVAYDLEVPALDHWWVSTPVLTDTLQQPPGQASVLPVLLARRTFAATGLVYCRFDVNGAAKDKATGMPRVSSGHHLTRSDGTVVSRADPTPILPTSLGAVTRMIGIPLDGVTPGDYELTLTVRDEIAGKSQEIREPFRVTSPSARR
jgi:VWFA-related protein